MLEMYNKWSCRFFLVIQLFDKVCELMTLMVVPTLFITILIKINLGVNQI